MDRAVLHKKRRQGEDRNGVSGHNKSERNVQLSVNVHNEEDKEDKTDVIKDDTQCFLSY